MGPEGPLLPDRPLRSGERVVVFTGAGVSKESGLPTFREAQTGLWARFRPEELATPEAFRRQPDVVWRWYAWRRELVERAVPNPAHLALVRLEERLGDDLTLVTQNVDGLHRRAGSRRVLELHGDILRTVCSGERCPDRHQPIPASDLGEGEPPACPRCGAPLRPDVVWFGEALPREALEAAFEAASRCHVMLVVGTSGLVHPAASLVPAALAAGAEVLVVDPGESGWDHPRLRHLKGESGKVVPGVVEGLVKGSPFPAARMVLPEDPDP